VAAYEGVRGSVALVAGASRGIGRGIALSLAEQGAQVVGTSRDKREADELAELFGSPSCVLDVTDPGSIERAVAEVTRVLGPIQSLVNNAGVNVPRPFLDATVDEWDLVMTTNARGSFLLSQAVARQLVQSRLGGAIVSIGSQAGIVGIEERAAYCASKSALVGLTRVMAIELATHGITANCVAPTFVETELTRSTLARPELRDRFLSRIPLQRFAEVDDVVGAVDYLIGPRARMVTGQVLVVDGGWTSW
jgi:NAD(P)-dependent dehydrogenase (short-subunit alcohol dehydrogenase family)